jgi:hypothetical protein
VAWESPSLIGTLHNHEKNAFEVMIGLESITGNRLPTGAFDWADANVSFEEIVGAASHPWAGLVPGRRLL